MEQEIHSAISKLCVGKAPRCDGLIVSFYKHYATHLVPLLCTAFNAAFDNNLLSPLQQVAILILLFKKGDKKVAGNYRSISLTNIDYKILAYVLMARLKPALDDLIHPSQTAYLPGKFISTNIWKIQDAIDFTRIHDKQWVVLFLDFCKAFDSISHLFLYILLHSIGFSGSYIAWIALLYCQAESMARNKGWFLQKIWVVMQGQARLSSIMSPV